MWRELLQAVIELLYPSRMQCPLCGAYRPDESLCPDCRQLLAGYTGERVCSLCGAFLGSTGAGGRGKLICPTCRSENRSFDLARASAPYEGPVREAVLRLKYRGRKPLARPLGQVMAATARREKAFARAEALVPVPLHPQRERERGYNQSVLLASVVGEALQLPVLEQVVVKVIETPSQTALTGRLRRQNLQQAFAVVHPGLVNGKNILIIDDVFTTGSTISSLSHLLRQSGAVGVMALTFAGTRQNEK
ncbi:DNA utilization protein GntX [Sporotomaculum syntrophicum]|uniref:DNA utilization protein GntX n=1 Tax=Sporotomaculum syntrophicum TaxID=182264 RepID=A0A9D2WRM2_9FIRM|nr:ComF family protein [Sporotomaculum syntrophicum]KAF1086104.1 DNA utilization protein GntX [Sporotomaculum syntrophicum]